MDTAPSLTPFMQKAELAQGLWNSAGRGAVKEEDGANVCWETET